MTASESKFRFGWKLTGLLRWVCEDKGLGNGAHTFGQRWQRNARIRQWA
jgi:hypothetical protein